MADDATAAPSATTLDVSGYTPPDKRFGKPFIDVDEWQDGPRKMRYIHGGFADTHTRFSFYFPPKEQYRGRFFQFLEAAPAAASTCSPRPCRPAWTWAGRSP
jgi:hypothetical protein